ncbi:hypothetical protein HYFRA_00001496 [Hymenoscyphus fraxineus]|uniref:Uncharacterized protein n=1 Tax=Hymenoscyphus fraxineus TaxID=746836 RepID=A0A9N9L502_9HELO|nr:hypothetical protein HYFRA_00001496 [Hymenoscyphus fraxineus]
MTADNTMASTARLVMERALRNHTTLSFNGTSLNGTWESTRAAAEESANNVTEATGLLIKKLAFAESKSVRTSTIILAAFNVLAALATASSILYDSYMATKRCNPKFKSTKFCISKMHPAETFPLILAIGIAIQGFAFMGVQGTGLQSLFVKGCDVFAQFLLPALFLVPYIKLVFGVECAIRSLRARPFQARGKYDVTICCALVLVFTIGTWVYSYVVQENETCFASLMWFLTIYGEVGLIMLSIIAAIMLASALTIYFRLSNVDLVDEHQRIAASRMVYYLVLGLLSLAFVIPWFASLVTDNGGLKQAMIGTVVVNLSGLINGLLHLFLRANTASTSFGRSGSNDVKKHEIRIWGPNELVFLNHQTMSPVSTFQDRLDSRAGLVGDEKGSIMSMDSSVSSNFTKFAPTSRFNEKVYPSVTESEIPTYNEPTREHATKPSYSLFPVETAPENNTLGVPKMRQDPTSIYDITDLAAPPKIFSRGHGRNPSIISTATVQIGLRLSHAPESNDSTIPFGLPSTTYEATPAPKFLAPSPLKLVTQDVAHSRPQSPLRLANSTSPRLNSTSVKLNSTSPRLSPKSTTLNYQTSTKTLPPTPRANLLKRTDSDPIQLSPAVYSPAKSSVVRSDSKASTYSRVSDESRAEEVSRKASLSRGPLRGNPMGSPVKPTKNSARKNEWI